MERSAAMTALIVVLVLLAIIALAMFIAGAR